MLADGNELEQARRRVKRCPGIVLVCGGGGGEASPLEFPSLQHVYSQANR